MHRINKIAVDNNAFNEYVTENIKNEVKRLVEEYEKVKDSNDLDIVTKHYLRLLYNIPSGLKLTAGIVTNVGQLKTMIQQRKNHKLPEWKYFCEYWDQVCDMM